MPCDGGEPRQREHPTSVGSRICPSRLPTPFERGARDRARRHPARPVARLGRLDTRAGGHGPLGAGDPLDLHGIRPAAGIAQHRDGPLHARNRRARLRGLHAPRPGTSRLGTRLHTAAPGSGRLAGLGAGRGHRPHRCLPWPHASRGGQGRGPGPGLRDLPRSGRGNPARSTGAENDRMGRVVRDGLDALLPGHPRAAPRSRNTWRAVAVGFVSPAYRPTRSWASTGCC